MNDKPYDPREKFCQPLDPNDISPVVQLTGEDGNTFNALALCHQAATRVGWTQKKIDAVMAEMRSGDYDHLLRTAKKYFVVK